MMGWQCHQLNHMQIICTSLQTDNHTSTSSLSFQVIASAMTQQIGTQVCPSVRTSPKSFSDFHLIWCVGRPRPHMRTSVTSTRSKVKVKVTELPKLQKVHFFRSISSTISAWSSKVMVGGHSMGPALQLVGARFLNFHLGKLSREFKLRPISIFDEIQMAKFQQCVTLQSRG